MPTTSLLNAGKVYNFGGGINGDCVVIKLTQNNEGKATEIFKDTSFVANQVSAQIAKQIRKIYALGSDYYYYVDGRPDGTISMQTVVGMVGSDGSKEGFFKVLQNLSDVCKGSDLIIGVKSGCVCDSDGNLVEGVTGTALKFSGVVLTGVTIAAQSTDYLVAGSCTFTCYDAAPEDVNNNNQQFHMALGQR